MYNLIIKIISSRVDRALNSKLVNDKKYTLRLLCLQKRYFNRNMSAAPTYKQLGITY